MNNDVFSFISPSLLGRMTKRDLIKPLGTILIRSRYERFPKHGILFFKLDGLGYFFETGVDNNRFYIQRNEDRVEMPFTTEYETTGIVALFFAWEPTRLQVVLFDRNKETGQ